MIEPIGSGAAPDERIPLPDHLTLDLGVTKADPEGKNAPVPIADAKTVETMWEWMHARSRGAATVFAYHDGSALSIADLVGALNGALRRTIPGEYDHALPGRIGGRSFRRGGAAEAAERGVSWELIAEHGRWKTLSVARRYAGQKAEKNRRLLIAANQKSAKRK